MRTCRTLKAKVDLEVRALNTRGHIRNEYKAQEHIVTRSDFAGKLVASVRYGLVPHPPLCKTMNKRRSAFQK